MYTDIHIQGARRFLSGMTRMCIYVQKSLFNVKFNRLFPENSSIVTVLLKLLTSAKRYADPSHGNQ